MDGLSDEDVLSQQHATGSDGAEILLLTNSMKLVSPLHSLYWSIHTKDESKIVKSIWSSLGLLFLCQIKTIAISKFSVTIFKLLLSFYGTQ